MDLSGDIIRRMMGELHQRERAFASAEEEAQHAHREGCEARDGDEDDLEGPEVTNEGTERTEPEVGGHPGD